MTKEDARSGRLRRMSPGPGFHAFGMWIGMGTSRLHWSLDYGLFQWCWKERLRDDRAARRAIARL